MKKVEKPLEQNAQQQQPINTNPLQIYINQIIELNEKPESESDINNNIIAITAFQQYISSKFHQLYPINEGKTFLNDVFVSISLHALHNNSKLFLIFASALIGADIGDKYFKANRIAKDLNNITPFEINDTKSWETLEKLLLWLKKHLGTSINVTINIFKDKILQWFIPTDLKSYLSSLHILNLLLRQFPISITSILNDAEKIIIDSIQSNEEIVRNLGCRTLESALSIEDSPFHYMCISISHLLFSETNYPSEGLINAVYSVIKSAPSISTLFTFAEPPLKRLVQDQSSNNFQLLVLAYRITPSLFTDEDMNTMLSLFLNFIQKKNIRKIALITLGEIAFMGFVRIHKDHSDYVKKFISMIYPKSLNSEEAGFALLSLISPMNREFSEQFMSILTLPLTKLLLEGLQKFVSNYPVMAPTIRKRMIPLVTPILSDDVNKRETLMINTLETMLFMKYVKDEISIGCLTQYSRLLSVDNILLNEKISDLLLYFQDDFPILRFRLLSFISCSSFDELRLSVLRRLNYSHELCSVFKSLLNDRNPKISLEAMRILCDHMEEEMIRDFLNDTIQRFPLYDSTRYRHLIKMYLLIAHKFLYLFEPICNIVFDTFFKIEFHFPSSLELLSLLIKLNSKYCDHRVIQILEDHLKLHSTIMILRSSLDLLLSVIDYTSIPLSNQLLIQLFDVSRYAEDKELQLRLYIVFSYLSNIMSDRVEHKKKNLTIGSEQFGAIPLIYSLGSSDSLTSLTYASVAVSLNLLFEIVADDSLASLHSSALEALIRILKNFRHIGDDLSEILVQKLGVFLSNSIPSTVSLFLNNFSLFAMVFGEKMKSIIPHVIDLICSHWGVLDNSLLLRITEWIIMTFQSVFKPYIFKVTTLFVSDLFARTPETVNLIFSTLVSYGPLIKEVHSLVIPSILEWINNTNINIDFNILNDILMKLKSILLNLEENKYGLTVLRTLSYLLQRIDSNQDDTRIMDLFCLVVLQMRSEFLLFYPEFAKIIKQHKSEKLTEIIHCLSQKIPIPRKITTLYRPSFIEKPRPQSMAVFNVSFDVLNYSPPKFTLPPKTVLSDISIEEEDNDEEEDADVQSKANDYEEEELNSNENELYSLEERPKRKKHHKSFDTKTPNKMIAEHEAINRSSARFSFIRHDPFEEFSVASWEQWIDNTASLFIQSSPSIAISASSAISDKHNHMKMSLFPLALALSVAMSRSNPVWSELFNRIFTSPNIPSFIVRLFLSAIEFLEIVRIDPLPVSYELLATSAMNSGQTVMALRYTELNFLDNPMKFSEQLIRLNQKLGMKMSANGVLRYLKKEAFITRSVRPKSNCPFKSISSFSSNSNISFQGGGLIQLLGYWEDALVDLDSKIVNKPNDNTLLENKMYCLYQLSRFKELQEISENRSPIFSAIAAWNNLNINKFKEEFGKIPKETLDSYSLDITPQNLIFIYYEILFCVTNHEYEKAKSLIDLIRKNYSSNLFPLLWDDEERATPIICDGTLLCEIEEIMSLFKLKEESNKTDFSYIPFNAAINSFNDPKIDGLQSSNEPLRNIWNQRVDFACSRKDQKTFYNLILIRSLVLNQEEMKSLWYRFIRSTQSSGLTEMAMNALGQIGEQNYGQYLEIKTLYKTNPDKAISQIYEQLEILRDQVKLVKNENEKQTINKKINYFSKTLGKWLVNSDRFKEAETFLKDAFSDSFFLTDSIDDWKIYFLFSKCSSSPYNSFESLLQCVKKNPSKALKFTPKIFSLLFSGSSNTGKSEFDDLIINYDTEFDEHEKTEIINSFKRNYTKTSPNVWLFHLPQIISMLGTEYNDLMKELLLYIATEHLQDVAHAVVSESRNGKKNCDDIINNLKQKHPIIITNLILFTGELIRIASTWYEIFNTLLDEASRKYVVESERDKFEKLLKSIQEFFSQEATSLIDLQFKTEYGQLISETEDLYDLYQKTKEEFYIHEIWQLYVEIFKKLRFTIEKFTSFNLCDVSSTMSELKNSELTVPFCADDVHISSIVDKITIINSKQKPRKIGIVGINGRTYSFLLKANEDTRLDERIMQFFTLYNSLIDADMPQYRSNSQNRKEKFSDKKRLHISTYGIRPLSNNVGLIGWVSGCTTLFDVLKKNRDRWHIDVNAELQTTMSIAPNYERLPGDQKYAPFVAGLQATSGDDIKETLVANALDASHWHLRRRAYTASLASTSMVGYVIGLGDRHFGNIMMKTGSAKLVHIDFGDSFEVTKYRKTFPEIVPFRLTRVMVKALEAAGVEGSFRELSQLIMETMISNREMIMGVLETFVQDPVLVDRNKSDPKQVLARISQKLSGVDFGAAHPMPVEKQVDILIKEAQDLNNLCRMYTGWRPWW